LATFGKPCPVSDLFGVAGRDLLGRVDVAEPWRGDLEAALRLIDTLDTQISDLEAELRNDGAGHPYVPLLLTVPDIGWILAYTIAAEIGAPASTAPRSSPATPGCARGSTNPVERTTVAASPSTVPATCAGPSSRRQPTPLAIPPAPAATSTPLAASAALARTLAEAIWHMLTKGQPFNPYVEPAARAA
jgi:hypothetical protein